MHSYPSGSFSEVQIVIKEIFRKEEGEPTPVTSMWGKNPVKELCAAIQEVVYFRQLGLNIKFRQY